MGVTVYSRVLGKTVVVELDFSITMKLPLVLFIAMAFSVCQSQAQNGLTIQLPFKIIVKVIPTAIPSMFSKQKAKSILRKDTLPGIPKSHSCVEFNIDYPYNDIIRLKEVYSYSACSQICKVFSPICKGWSYADRYDYCWLKGQMKNQRRHTLRISGHADCVEP